MSKRAHALLGSLRRRSVSLLTAMSFLVLAITGVIAFVRPFSIEVVGLHALMGFAFIALIALHVINNIRPLKGYLHGKAVWVALGIVALMSLLFWVQPAPVKKVLSLSGNLGPAQERFEMGDDQMTFNYSPSPGYRMELRVRMGPSYDAENPPAVAIWLENQGAYHIKTLLMPETIRAYELPYWKFKRMGWEQAKLDAADAGDVDVVSSPTPNGSFDPADYILPEASGESTPYRLLIEINQLDDAHGTYDDQPSLVYAVEIDNSLPRVFQLLDLQGYPKQEGDGADEDWALYYTDETFGSALELIDSALLTIERKE